MRALERVLLVGDRPPPAPAGWPAPVAWIGLRRERAHHDAAIAARIRSDKTGLGEIWCPHTAVAAEVWHTLPPSRRLAQAWCIVSTAAAAKFPEIVEPLIGEKVPVPHSLAALLDRPSRFEEIGASLEDLRAALA